MGNCCICKRNIKRKIILLLVGLDNAGKTVAVKGLAGEDPNGSIPTVGFSVVNLNYLDYEVYVYDLGGGSEIRGIWRRYFVDAHGVIFVIDASDYERFDEVKSVLTELLSHEKISGKPLLILANKQDNKEALDEIDIVEKLELENLVNEKKCPTLVESCAAKESGADPGIQKGYQWLVNFIIKEYAVLNQRVEDDVHEQREIDEKQRREKIERLKLCTVSESVENNDSDIVKIENPFRPISELVNGKVEVEARPAVGNHVHSPAVSVKSATYSEKQRFEKQNNNSSLERPKSAMEVVRKQLEKSGRRSSFLAFPTNKTAPLTLLSPKSAPIKRSEPDEENAALNFASASQTGQILTVTELPNAIIDANGENIGDLFEFTNFTVKKLPPIRQKTVYEYNGWVNKSGKNNSDVLQNNIDEIYKDVS